MQQVPFFTGSREVFFCSTFAICFLVAVICLIIIELENITNDELPPYEHIRGFVTLKSLH